MFREEWGEIIIETVQKFMKPDAIKLNIYKYKGQKYLWSLSQDVLQMSVLASESVSDRVTNQPSWDSLGTYKYAEP